MPSPPTTPMFYNGASELDLTAAGEALRAGKLIAFPTETVYGLGADATNADAVRKIFSAKKRPQDNPLIVHLSSPHDVQTQLLTPLPLPAAAARLIAAFWPGPLTLVLPLHPQTRLAGAVTAGLRSVGLRVPKHPVAAALLARAGVPVAAPSANLSGRPSPTCAAHVMRDLGRGGVLEGVVDGGEGELFCGVESTVVDLSRGEEEVAVLRPGAVSAVEIEAVAGVRVRRYVGRDYGEGERVVAPGMKYRHYAPRAPLFVVKGGRLGEEIEVWRGKGEVVGVLGEKEVCERVGGVEGVRTVVCGGRGDVGSFARELYKGLRAFDGEGELSVDEVGVILAVPPKDVDDGIGEAILNRLIKAAAAGSIS